jgi:putative ABC transport system substrate-binding protein
VRRREFITLLGGAAAAWPLAARAQQLDRMRRIGVLMSLAADDPEGQARMAAFLQGLQQLGWTDGRNMRIDSRWAEGNADDVRKYAAELVAFAPDVILSPGSFTVGPMLQATRSVPIVFVHVPDPIGAGFVDSLARPGGNATGFTQFEYSTSGKWLELLKEIAPGVTRAAVVRDPAITAGIGQWSAIQAVATSLGVEVSPVNVRLLRIVEVHVRQRLPAATQTDDLDIVLGAAVGDGFMTELRPATTTRHRHWAVASHSL